MLCGSLRFYSCFPRTLEVCRAAHWFYRATGDGNKLGGGRVGSNWHKPMVPAGRIARLCAIAPRETHIELGNDSRRARYIGRAYYVALTNRSKGVHGCFATMSSS